jgi:excinuclease UvrABC nuclease subunit
MASGSILEIPAPVHLSEIMRQDLMRSGVYFLYHDGIVVYVGQARTLLWRIDQHIAEGRKIFDAVSFIPCRVRDLTPIERSFIEELAPKYNRCGVAKRARKESPWHKPERQFQRSRRGRRNRRSAAQKAAALLFV